MPLIISSQSLIDDELSTWLGINIATLTIIGTYNLLYNASLLINDGNTAAICIDGIINTTETNLKFIPFYPELPTNTNMIWKPNSIFSSASKLFLRKLLE